MSHPIKRNKGWQFECANCGCHQYSDYHNYKHGGGYVVCNYCHFIQSALNYTTMQKILLFEFLKKEEPK
jgi:hypothetical protein